MSNVRRSSAYPKDETIFKKLYNLCASYQARIDNELKLIDHSDPILLEKKKAITALLAELASNNNNDQKIRAIAEKLAEVKKALSKKRGLGQANLLSDSKGKKLVENLVTLITPRLKMVHSLKEEHDIYFVEINRCLVKFDKNARPQFNTELMNFLKGKKAYLVRSFDHDYPDYIEPLCSEIEAKLVESGVLVQAVCMPKDVYGLSHAYRYKEQEAKAFEHKERKAAGINYKLGQTYEQELKPLEEALIKAQGKAKAVLSEWEFQLCKENMEFQEIFTYLKRMVQSDSTKRMPLSIFLGLAASVESVERFGFAFLKVNNIATMKLRFKEYLRMASEQNIETAGDFLDYLEKTRKTLKLSADKVKAFFSVEQSLYQLARFRGTQFFEQKQFNRSESDLHRKAWGELTLSQHDRVIIINSDKGTHSLINSMHRQEKQAHGLLTTLPFAGEKKEERLRSNDSSCYVPKGEFSASIHSPATLLIQLELQTVLYDSYNLNLLKVDAKKPHMKVEVHNQTYLLPPAIGEMVRLFKSLPPEATALEIYKWLLVFKDTANDLKDKFSHGVASAFYQVITEGLEMLTADPDIAQKKLSAGLIALEDGLRGKPVDASSRDSISKGTSPFERIKNELLNPINLREWSATHSSSEHPPRKRFGCLFSTSTKKENVLVRQPSGQWGLYVLPEPIAKMVLLALKNQEEALMDYATAVIKSSTKLGDKPAHQVFQKELRAFVDPDCTLHLSRTLV